MSVRRIPFSDETKNIRHISLNNSPVLTDASKAKKPIAYIIDFFLSNLPGFKIQAVAGCTMNT